MIAPIAPVIQLLKRVFLRCRKHGCWRRGMPCADIDFMNLSKPAKHWRQCEHHLDLERVAELERQRNDPKILMQGDRVRVLKCRKPEECSQHGNHEGTLSSTTYSPDADPNRPPLEPAKPRDFIFHVNSDEGVHYHALAIDKIIDIK